MAPTHDESESQHPCDEADSGIFHDLFPQAFWATGSEQPNASNGRDPRISLLSLWDQEERELDGEDSAGPAPLTPAVSVFQDGLDFSQLWADVLDDGQDDEKTTYDEPHNHDVFQKQDTTGWSLDKIFLAARDAILLRVPSKRRSPKRIIGKGRDTAELLRRALSLPFAEEPGPRYSWRERQQAYRRACSWVRLLGGVSSRRAREDLRDTWRGLSPAGQYRWHLLDLALQDPKLQNCFPEMTAGSKGLLKPDAGGSPGPQGPKQCACFGYLATYNTQLGLKDPMVVNWVNEGRCGQELRDLLSHHPPLLEAFASFVAFHERVAEQCGFKTVCVSMEHSSASPNPARVHFHAYVGTDVRGGHLLMARPKVAPISSSLLCMDEHHKPLVRFSSGKLRPSIVYNIVAHGIYYVCGAKEGTLRTYSNVSLFKDPRASAARGADSRHPSRVLSGHRIPGPPFTGMLSGLPVSTAQLTVALPAADHESVLRVVPPGSSAAGAESLESAVHALRTALVLLPASLAACFPPLAPAVRAGHSHTRQRDLQPVEASKDEQRDVHFRIGAVSRPASAAADSVG